VAPDLLAVIARVGSVRRRLGVEGEAARALEVAPVLLEVAGDVLAGDALDVHDLHDGLGHGGLVAELLDRLDEPAMELRGPHHPRLLPGLAVSRGDGGLRLPVPPPLILVVVEVVAGEGQVRGGGVGGGGGASDVDLERGGERGRDELVRERRQLRGRGQAGHPLEHAVVAPAGAHVPQRLGRGRVVGPAAARG
jgi:hypothetical protein